MVKMPTNDARQLELMKLDESCYTGAAYYMCDSCINAATGSAVTLIDTGWRIVFDEPLWFEYEGGSHEARCPRCVVRKQEVI